MSSALVILFMLCLKHVLVLVASAAYTLSTGYHPVSSVGRLAIGWLVVSILE